MGKTAKIKPKAKIKSNKFFARGITLFKAHKVIGVIVLLVLAITAYNLTADQVEKYQLLAKYSRLDKVAGNIASKYPADKQVSERHCGHGNYKGEKGPTSCTYDITFIYNNLDMDQANAKKDEISKLQSSPLFNNLNNGTNFLDKDSPGDWSRSINNGYIGQDLDDKKLKNCSISYKYETYKKQQLQVSVLCVDGTRREHFPERSPLANQLLYKQ